MFMAAPFGKSGVVTFLAPMQDITDADFMQIVATRGAPTILLQNIFGYTSSLNLRSTC